MPDIKKSKLAAIMFTDIVGYSGMMEEDEERTIRVVKEHNSILFPLVEEHGGAIIDAIGDGLLVVFDSARSAAECAIHIQQGIDAYNRSVGPSFRFRIRIGIHLGDIWFEENRIFGNGVNIAARLEPLANPGGICVSGDIYRQISNKMKIDVYDQGETYLKNIKESVRVYQLKTGVEGEQIQENQDDVEETIKREIQEAQMKLKAKREAVRDGQPHDWEERLEGQIAGFVGNVLDKALTEWNNAPEEKKEKAREKLAEKNIDISLGTGGPKIVVGDGHGSSKKKKKKEEEKPGDELMVGIVASLGFGYGYFIAGFGWMILPFILIGLLPLAIGMGRWIKGITGRKSRLLEHRRELERHILAKMREAGGRASVVTLAADTDLSLDEIQDHLVDMTKKGYISQDIDTQGTLMYSIPEMLSYDGDR